MRRMQRRGVDDGLHARHRFAQHPGVGEVADEARGGEGLPVQADHLMLFGHRAEDGAADAAGTSRQ
jgi:hypothetical protein